MHRSKIRSELAARGFTRRDIGRMMALLTAGTALPFFNEAAMAQLSSLGRIGPDAVLLNANESPYGPFPAALEALVKIAQDGNRYQYYEADELAEAIGDMEGLDRGCVVPYAGSSLALHHAVIAFTSPEKGLVTADPGYEAAARAAQFVGAKVTRVPLVKDTAAHDLKTMLDAGADAGLFYVCNPNNPTGTVSPHEEIASLVKNKPAGSVIMIDEAYIHFSDEPFTTPLVKAGHDVVILRTFSKIYGMAGLRAGYAIGRPELVSRMSRLSAGGLPVTAMRAAKVSLSERDVMAERKKLNTEVRTGVIRFLDEHGFATTPSVSNNFMVDTRRPVRSVISEMATERVYIGRPWPAWPTHARVTVGTKEEMERFQDAFLKAMERVEEVSL